MENKKNELLQLSDEEVALLKRWKYPEVEDENEIIDETKTNLLNKPLDWRLSLESQEQEEIIEEEIKPLTAEEIEIIRQAAYEDGFAEGKEAGFEAGYNEGRESGQQDGLTQGHAEGKKQGFDEGAELVQQQAESWRYLVEQLNTPLRNIDEQVEQQLIHLTALLAEAVIGIEIQTNPQIILNTLKECINALPINDAQCEIQLHPQDIELIKEYFGEEALQKRSWQLIAEPSLQPGGCIVESRTSSIDRQLQTRINATIKRFLQDSGVLENNNA